MVSLLFVDFSVINLENSDENKGRRKRDRTKIRADEIRADKVSNKLYRNDKFQKIMVMIVREANVGQLCDFTRNFHK